MSTTVTYKGETLTTVDNATVTLNTAGKYCEDDFTLTDVSGGGGGVQTANVTIEFNDADYLYYTDANMTVHSVTSGSRDLNGVPIPIGSLVVCVRSGTAPPVPITTACLNEIASYAVGSRGIVRIYEVFDELA